MKLTLSFSIKFKSEIPIFEMKAIINDVFRTTQYGFSNILKRHELPFFKIR